MKKYRLTRIRIKTREIVRQSKPPADEAAAAICPLCRSPLALPVAESAKTNEKETLNEHLITDKEI
jgi:hypothetical protein